MERIGNYLEEVRLEKGLNKEDVAKEIGCEPYQVSRIEKGKCKDIKLFMKIIQNYDLNFTELLLSTSLSKLQLEYILKAKEKLRNLASENQYNEMGKLLKNLWRNPAFRKTDPSFLHWHQGIYDFYHGKDFDLARKHLQMAKTVSSSLHPKRLYEIQNTLACMFIENNEPIEANSILKTSVNNLQSIKTLREREPRIMILLLHNLSFSYYLLDDFQNSSNACNEALRICNQHQCSFYKGELYYQLGLSQFYLGHREKALNHMISSIFHLKEQARETLIKLVRAKCRELGLGELPE